ncbi:hypothetical protein [Pseudoleptotrichia goodfellowii]|uniref:Uncharacterized protein n=1 Tax=Pseudoleptotrichia goodfellowii TaxID=157692 RepID=A0A510JBW9_9FUSO|nr:hypothetical protein [Pseudoleptotrichia goodfellowii]BBM36697.1 hypothetical protein JCM16774_1641 [Pseudoleptotrichia goodfellowii]
MKTVKIYEQNKKSGLKLEDELKKIKDNKISIKKLFEKYNGNYEKIDLDWDSVIGKETLQ